LQERSKILWLGKYRRKWTRGNPREEMYGLTRQIRRASASISAVDSLVTVDGELHSPDSCMLLDGRAQVIHWGAIG